MLEKETQEALGEMHSAEVKRLSGGEVNKSEQKGEMTKE